MDGLLVAVRAVHFGATIVLFGETLFAVLAAAYTTEGEPNPSEVSLSAHHRFLRVATWAWVAMAISGACWLALVSVQMSGGPLGEALTRSSLATVLGATIFGQAWSVRALLALGLAAMWPLLHGNPMSRRWVWFGAVTIAGGLLAGLAWAGHANVEVGADSWAHHASDAAHLLGAGAWLGGLAALAALLSGLMRSPTTRAIDECAEATARFGNWAALSVSVILLTGIVNAYYLLPHPRALLETSYGNLLLAKLLVFSIMLGIAAANRTRLTAVLRADRGDARARLAAARRLRRNVWMEQVLGAAVVVLVAALGVTPPPMRM